MQATHANLSFDPLTPTAFGFFAQVGPESFWALIGSISNPLGSDTEVLVVNSMRFDRPFDPGLTIFAVAHPVPEPAIIILMGSGFLGVFAFRRKFRTDIKNRAQGPITLDRG